MAVLVALIRGFTRRTADGHRQLLGRSDPQHALRAAAALLRARARCWSRRAWCRRSDPTSRPTLLDSTTRWRRRRACADQVLALGPAASQIAIKQLGTNGGGFFNVNSAHPFENPTPLSNFLEVLSILLIPAALCFTFGAHGQGQRQGWAVLAAMLADLHPAAGGVRGGRAGAAIPCCSSLGVDQIASALQAGGNMEGKEVRFGIVDTALWATATTAASNGSVNAMHDSFTPLGGLVPMWLMQLGEIVFGGVGSGLYGMLIYAIIAVFIAGLMVGRTPEYLGKKIEAFEMKMASLVILLPAAAVLIGTAIACVVPAGTATLGNPGIARLQRDPVRVLVGREQQRLGLRRHHRQRPLLRHRDRHLHVDRSLLGDRARARHRRLARAARSSSRPAPAPCRRTRRSSSRCSPARWCWSVRSPSFPRSRSVRSSSTSRCSRAPGIVQDASTMTSDRPHARVAEAVASRIPDALPRRRRVRCSRRRSCAAHCVDAFASSTRAAWSATRSCSWSRWAAPSPRLLFLHALITGQGEAAPGFILAVSVWLWFTVLFANFAEAMAEGRGKAQADTLRKARQDVIAKRLDASRAVTPRARNVASALPAPGRRRAGRGRRPDPRRRRGASRASPRSTRAPSPARARR